jgi:hypothetical protein
VCLLGVRGCGLERFLEHESRICSAPRAVARHTGHHGTDHLNTLKMVTRAAVDAIMWRWDQDPFGTAVELTL